MGGRFQVLLLHLRLSLIPRRTKCVSSPWCGVITGAGKYASPLFRGNSIGPARVFLPGAAVMFRSQGVEIYSSSYHRSVFGPWVNVQNRYLGVEVPIDGVTHYGWIRLSSTIGKYRVSAFTLTGYAYETVAGQPIKAGQTYRGSKSAGRIGAVGGAIVGNACTRVAGTRVVEARGAITFRAVGVISGNKSGVPVESPERHVSYWPVIRRLLNTRACGSCERWRLQRFTHPAKVQPVRVVDAIHHGNTTMAACQPKRWLTRVSIDVIPALTT